MPKAPTPCPFCGASLSIEGIVPRKEACPACARDLHACEACGLYDTTAHNKCREPKAEWQPKRDRSNFCDFFEIATGGPATGEGEQKETARKSQLDDLFKNF